MIYIPVFSFGKDLETSCYSHKHINCKRRKKKLFNKEMEQKIKTGQATVA